MKWVFTCILVVLLYCSCGLAEESGFKLSFCGFDIPSVYKQGNMSDFLVVSFRVGDNFKPDDVVVEKGLAKNKNTVAIQDIKECLELWNLSPLEPGERVLAMWYWKHAKGWIQMDVSFESHPPITIVSEGIGYGSTNARTTAKDCLSLIEKVDSQSEDLVMYDAISFLLLFSEQVFKQCTECSEYGNEVLFDFMEKRPRLFFSALFSLEEKEQQAVKWNVEHPVHDGINVVRRYNAVKMSPELNSVLKEKALAFLQQAFESNKDILRDTEVLNLNWYEENYKMIHEKLKNGSEQEAEPILKAILDLWKHRDGLIGLEISSAMAEACIHHPDLTFSWFAANRSDFDEWVERVPYCLLTNYSDRENHQKLEKLRKRLSQAMKLFSEKTDNESYRAMAIQLQKQLEESPIRDID